MPSLSRSEAARRNGARSKGPVTPEGKARSSRNALKHGLTAANVTLSYEDKDEYRELLDGLRIELSPVGILENLALEEYVAALWAYHRALRLEPAFLNCDMEESEAHYEGDTLAARVLSNRPTSITNLSRYQRHHSRNADRALARLQQLQKLRLAQPKPVPSPAPEPIAEPAPPPRSSKSQNEPKPGLELVPFPPENPRNEPKVSPQIPPRSA